MKYIVAFCLIMGMAGCSLGLVLPLVGAPMKVAGPVALGGLSWFIIGCFLGIGYKFIKWMFHN